MLDINSINSSPKPKLERLALKGSIKVVISDAINDRIKFLCQSVPEEEWSGILFYDVDGTIQKPDEMLITVRDILLMDIKNKVSTGFDWGADYVDYMENNPDSYDWKVGLIHSHNSMNVFFSTEDWEELNDNCDRHNIYLSLIVNNVNDMEAKVAMFGQCPLPCDISVKDQDGEDFTLVMKEPVFRPFLITYDCEVKRTIPVYEVTDEFQARLKDISMASKIRKEKEKFEREAQEAKNKANGKTVFEGNVTKMDDAKYKSRFPSYVKDYDPKDFGSGEDDLKHSFATSTEEDGFACLLLRMGNEVNDDALSQAVEDLELADEIDGLQLASSTLENFSTYYSKYFEKTKNIDNLDDMLDVIENTINSLEWHEEGNRKVSAVIMALKSLGNKLAYNTKELSDAN